MTEEDALQTAVNQRRSNWSTFSMSMELGVKTITVANSNILVNLIGQFSTPITEQKITQNVIDESGDVPMQAATYSYTYLGVGSGFQRTIKQKRKTTKHTPNMHWGWQLSAGMQVLELSDVSVPNWDTEAQLIGSTAQSGYEDSLWKTSVFWYGLGASSSLHYPIKRIGKFQLEIGLQGSLSLLSPALKITTPTHMRTEGYAIYPGIQSYALTINLPLE